MNDESDVNTSSQHVLFLLVKPPKVQSEFVLREERTFFISLHRQDIESRWSGGVICRNQNHTWSFRPLDGHIQVRPNNRLGRNLAFSMLRKDFMWLRHSNEQYIVESELQSQKLNYHHFVTPFVQSWRC